ncbi:MAG: hypothetical protein JRI55_38610 [Deltaproteobacteria bacterium]|nr:hypothetical protein [Deltaproteobacteria bacterium]
MQGFSGVVLVDAATGDRRVLSELKRLGTDPVLVFSRNGSRLLLVDDESGQGWVWDADGAKLLAELSLVPNSPRQPRGDRACEGGAHCERGIDDAELSPDGLDVLARRRDGTLVVMRLADEASRLELGGGPQQVTAAAYSADGRALLVALHGDCDQAAQREVERCQGRAGWSEIVLYDATTLDERRRIAAHTRPIQSITSTVSPRRVVTGTVGEARVWELP